MGSLRRLGATANPLIVVQWIVAVSTVIGGAYVLSPFLRLSMVVNGKSALLQTAGSDIGIIIFGIIFLLTGLLLIAGIVKRKVAWRSVALFLNGLARFYVLAAVLLSQGILPLSWLSNATLMIIVFYIWARIRKRGVE